ncbi:pimeloyl-ACP methyl ester carboxylesterase [Rhodoligotrophos appendicifer]
MTLSTTYNTIDINKLPIFYREAGPHDGPTLLLLHGLPSSSRMYEPLLLRLADRYRLIAPDYPGFGHSASPPPSEFAYTFDHLAEIMTAFTDALDLSRYSLFMQDYGGPVGFRMATAHPERVDALIIQNAVAHDTGLSDLWGPRRAFWADRAAHEDEVRRNLLSLEATRRRHLGSDPRLERYDPDLWTDEFAFLSRPGQADIQTELFYDYRSNVTAYPSWQEWMRRNQPQLLVLWGKYDPSFDISEPDSYRCDVPNAEVHILDAGHFALDTAADEVAELVHCFLESVLADAPASRSHEPAPLLKESAMNDMEIIDSSFSAVINAPIDRIDIPEWCFSLPEKDYQACSPAHIAAGFTTAPDGRRMSINVEVIGGSLMVQHYVETLAKKDHLILESASDIFTPTGRTTLHIKWELSVRAIDGQRCEFTNHVVSTATDEFRSFLDRQGIPFDVFRAQRAPMSIAHNKGETPLFAASIERAALRK